jgi:serine/threonine protein kinase
LPPPSIPQRQRFKNEAHAAAQLHHTNIVPVYGVGCDRGIHYYAMQFIEGQTLAHVIADLKASQDPSSAALATVSGRGSAGRNVCWRGGVNMTSADHDDRRHF